MMYKNNTETTTRDWISLNTNEAYAPLIAYTMGEDFDALERIGRPEDPDLDEPDDPCIDEPDAGEMTATEYAEALATYNAEMAPYREALAAYEKALEAHEEAVREFEEELHGFPVAWNCMWSPRESVYGGQLEALTEAGFIVYAVSKHTDIPYGFDHVFGVDGAGYDFYDQHWRPLRAILSRDAAQRWLSKGYGSAADTVREHNELVAFLATEGGDEEPAQFITRYSLPVPETAAAE
jgi:hypothetical protein